MCSSSTSLLFYLSTFAKCFLFNLNSPTLFIVGSFWVALFESIYVTNYFCFVLNRTEVNCSRSNHLQARNADFWETAAARGWEKRQTNSTQLNSAKLNKSVIAQVAAGGRKPMNVGCWMAPFALFLALQTNGFSLPLVAAAAASKVKSTQVWNKTMIVEVIIVKTGN